jgi:hypothetical protein
MFGSWVLDVAIGLVAVYILFATICTTVREGIEGRLKMRAAFLERGIRELLNDEKGTGLSREFYEHPLIFSLFNGQYEPPKLTPAPGLFDRGSNLPSYIPSQNFALALMDIVTRGPVLRSEENSATNVQAPQVMRAPLTFATLRASVCTISNEPVARAMITAIDAAQGDLVQAQRNIEQWFDSTMDRVSGWYQRKTNTVIFVIAAVLAGGFNLDTFALVDHFKQETNRQATLAFAGKVLDQRAALGSVERTEYLTQQAAALTQVAPGNASTPTREAQRVADTNAMTQSLLFGSSLPIGWTERSAYPMRTWPLMIAGWLVTALAATLGAPFWFDILNRIMIVRSTVKSYEKSPEKGSKERSSAPSSWPQQAVTWTAAPGTFERRHAAQIPFDEAGDVDGCGECGQAEVDDKDLPQAHGGVR